MPIAKLSLFDSDKLLAVREENEQPENHVPAAPYEEQAGHA